jgi:hypothetical protein
MSLANFGGVPPSNCSYFNTRTEHHITGTATTRLRVLALGRLLSSYPLQFRGNLSSLLGAVIPAPGMVPYRHYHNKTPRVFWRSGNHYTQVTSSLLASILCSLFRLSCEDVDAVDP